MGIPRGARTLWALVPPASSDPGGSSGIAERCGRGRNAASGVVQPGTRILDAFAEPRADVWPVGQAHRQVHFGSFCERAAGLRYQRFDADHGCPGPRAGWRTPATAVIAMYAKIVGGQGAAAAVVVGEGFSRARSGLPDDPLWIVMHRAAKLPRCQPTVRQVGAIGEASNSSGHAGLVGQPQLAVVVGQASTISGRVPGDKCAGARAMARSSSSSPTRSLYSAPCVDSHLGTEGTAERSSADPRATAPRHAPLRQSGGQRAPASFAQAG